MSTKVIRHYYTEIYCKQPMTFTYMMQAIENFLDGFEEWAKEQGEAADPDAGTDPYLGKRTFMELPPVVPSRGMR